jgi:hypothetical protein
MADLSKLSLSELLKFEQAIGRSTADLWSKKSNEWLKESLCKSVEVKRPVLPKSFIDKNMGRNDYPFKTVDGRLYFGGLEVIQSIKY